MDLSDAATGFQLLSYYLLYFFLAHDNLLAIFWQTQLASCALRDRLERSLERFMSRVTFDFRQGRVAVSLFHAVNLSIHLIHLLLALREDVGEKEKISTEEVTTTRTKPLQRWI